jgi:hypothetical protein
MEVEGPDADGNLMPPWLALPLIPHGSIGWRMGVGEGYLDDLRRWWVGQPIEARLRLREAYPEPPEWTGFWRGMS